MNDELEEIYAQIEADLADSARRAEIADKVRQYVDASKAQANGPLDPTEFEETYMLPVVDAVKLLPETAAGLAKFAVTHPSAAIGEALMWLPQMNAGAFGLKGMTGQTALGLGGAFDMLAKGDEQIGKFAEHMVRNPEDWYHLIRGAVMPNDPPSDTELLKTFEAERP